MMSFERNSMFSKEQDLTEPFNLLKFAFQAAQGHLLCHHALLLAERATKEETASTGNY